MNATAPQNSPETTTREGFHEEPRRQHRRVVMGLGILGIAVLGLTTVTTGAYFTDSATAANNTFTTGTVKIGATPATSALTLPNMAPGDVVTAPITVTNAGTLAQRYAVVSSTDATDANFLASQLKLVVKTGVTTCSPTGNFSTTGTVAYASGVLGSTGGTKVIGDSATGAQAGDRNLAAGASEVLCAQVSLPTSTDNTYQGKTTTAVFTFNAEQTANNS